MHDSSGSIGNFKSRLLNALAKDAYRYGEFTLSSGQKSNHYVYCKPVTLSGTGLVLISELLLEHVEKESLAVAGLTLGADPLVSGVAMLAAQRERKLDALIVRKKPKGYGTGAWLEGPLPPKGTLVTVLEDVVTTGGSSLMAVNQLRELGYCVQRDISIVDRQVGGAEAMKQAGLKLSSLFLLDEIISQAKDCGA